MEKRLTDFDAFVAALPVWKADLVRIYPSLIPLSRPHTLITLTTPSA